MLSGEGLKVVSWNVAGGRPVESVDKLFDYSGENLLYFADQLAQVNPDVVCMQETHINDQRSIAEEIAILLGYQHVFDTPMSPSHIDHEYNLGLAVISKNPFTSKTYHVYPYPLFPLVWPKTGIEANRHDKMLQVVGVDGINIANTHMQPLRLFQYSYGFSCGAVFARQMEQIMLRELSAPLVFCGDFNFDKIDEAYGRLFKKLGLREALPDETTRPYGDGRKSRSDHILHTPDFSPVSAAVIKTNTDHYMCVADFQRV